MSQTVVGVLTDQIGGASRTESYRDERRGVLDGRRRVIWACPADRFRPVQPADIPVQAGHFGQQIGAVRHLELRHGKLWAVAEADDGWNLRRHAWQFSYQLLESRADGLYDLEAVAVVPRSATVCVGDIQVLDGEIGLAAHRVARDGGNLDELLHNAAAYRRRHAPLEIRGAALPLLEEPAIAATGAEPIEYRSAQQVDVTGRRRITVLAAPYGVEVPVQVRGKPILESFANTAFVGKQPARIYSTRDHDPQRLIGRVTDLQPLHPEGCYATIEVSDTPLGRESVELARDQVLAASVGFQAPGEHWQGRNRRKITKAVLREISLVADPAYPTHVVDVREHALAGVS